MTVPPRAAMAIRTVTAMVVASTQPGCGPTAAPAMTPATTTRTIATPSGSGSRSLSLSAATGDGHQVLQEVEAAVADAGDLAEIVDGPEWVGCSVGDDLVGGDLSDAGQGVELLGRGGVQVERDAWRTRAAGGTGPAGLGGAGGQSPVGRRGDRLAVPGDPDQLAVDELAGEVDRFQLGARRGAAGRVEIGPADPGGGLQRDPSPPRGSLRRLIPTPLTCGSAWDGGYFATQAPGTAGDGGAERGHVLPVGGLQGRAVRWQAAGGRPSRRRSAPGDDVHQLGRDDHDPGDGPVPHGRADLWRVQREVAELVLAGVGRHLETVAQLAVHLDHAGDPLGPHQLGVEARPCGHVH